ncbi:hypothetical protein [Cupriavidus pauculus]|uniref:Uncharacterized protein n=1 Tax=Cupriavidus pauculus TaxID=82633 RepID=A0A3G8H3U6_9BURK|nr:hypothetical protein [Cupriavidus pauculus]AZG14870.1 hypothetical protein EHF44_16370 [Cupriavidus pauculus]
MLNYRDDPMRQALTVGLATLIGRSAGALFGTDATSAALAAQNESLNNATSGTKKPPIPDDVCKMMEAERRALGQVSNKPGMANADVPPVVGPSPLVLGGAKAGSGNIGSILMPGGRPIGTSILARAPVSER